jgi:hypothetical protein
MLIQKRLIFYGLTYLMVFGSLQVYSQNNLTVRFVGGTEKTTSISSLSKITFSGNDMVMMYSNGSFEAIDLLSVQKIGFTILNALDSNGTGSTRMMVYPSPATGWATLTNIPKNASKAVLYSLDGSVLSVYPLSSSTQVVDVSTLPSGFYLIRVNNSTVKFAKK